MNYSNSTPSYCRHNSTQIHGFAGPYRFLSNFYPCRIELDGIVYQNAEAAFQAQKVLTIEEKRAFANLSPKESKGKGRRVKLRPDWEEVKDEIMLTVVLAKFRQNEEIQVKFLQTEEKELVETNTWNDKYWGKDPQGNGRNQLGITLTKARTILEDE